MHERGNERRSVSRFIASPPSISIFVLGVLVCFVGLGVWGLVALLVLCFPRLRDQRSSFTQLNDRPSCHGAHGTGEKKKGFSG